VSANQGVISPAKLEWLATEGCSEGQQFVVRLDPRAFASLRSCFTGPQHLSCRQALISGRQEISWYANNREIVCFTEPNTEVHEFDWSHA
jgi:hypothetical protein